MYALLRKKLQFLYFIERKKVRKNNKTVMAMYYSPEQIHARVMIHSTANHQEGVSDSVFVPKARGRHRDVVGGSFTHNYAPPKRTCILKHPNNNNNNNNNSNSEYDEAAARFGCLGQPHHQNHGGNESDIAKWFSQFCVASEAPGSPTLRPAGHYLDSDDTNNTLDGADNSSNGTNDAHATGDGLRALERAFGWPHEMDGCFFAAMYVVKAYGNTYATCPSDEVVEERRTLRLLRRRVIVDSFRSVSMSEWCRALDRLGTPSFDGFKQRCCEVVPNLYNDVQHPAAFLEFWRFVFHYLCVNFVPPAQGNITHNSKNNTNSNLGKMCSVVPDEEAQLQALRVPCFARHVPARLASTALFQIMNCVTPFAATFCHYVNERLHGRMLSFDQWMVFPMFARLVKHDFSNYDVAGCWPLLMDEYVTWSIENDIRVQC
eukprot:PhM_4_TR7545/c0_g1_i1/m.40470